MKKIIIAILLVLVLFIPTYIAIADYNAAQKNPVSSNAVTKMEITSPNGDSETLTKNKDGDMIDFFTTMNKAAKEASTLPTPLQNTKYYKVVYHSYDKMTEYRYYFSTDPEYCYYTDNNGAAYRIDKENAQQFLTTDYALCLFPSAGTPVLNLDTAELKPSKMSWEFKDYNGTYRNATAAVADSVGTYDVSSSLKLNFDVVPDYLLVTITNAKTGVVVFDDLYENIDNSIFANNIVYSVAVSAKWYESAERENRGEANYSFIANVLAPAAFYIGENEIDPGEFVVVSAKNVVDPSQVGFSSVPDIGFTPTFFSDGNYVHALIPIDMELPYSGLYTFTFTYGGVSQDMEVRVNNKKFSAQTHTFSAATVNTYRSAKALEEFDSVTKEYLTAKYDDMYWLDGSKLLEAVEGRSVRTGFGLNITLSANGARYRHEGVNYVVASGDKVINAMKGKVIYVGELTLSGKTIIVDHGGGLKSLYAHLGTFSCSTGDVVEAGQEIGVVGVSGFTEGNSFHYGLYVMGVPVCPYDPWDYGIIRSSALK